MRFRFAPRLALLLLFIGFSFNSQAQFLSQISSLSTVVSNDVALDASGNAYVTGGFIGTANFQEPAPVFSLSSQGLKDIFIAKYNPEGLPLWGFSIGGVAGGPGVEDEGLAIAVSSSGNVFVTGYFQGTADFDPGSGIAEITSSGFRDVFMASYTSDGQFRWAESFGGAADDRGHDVGISNDGTVYFTGFFRQTAALFSDSNTTIDSAGEEDGFLLSLDDSGSLNWVFGYGDISVDKGNRVDTDAAGNVYLLGIFSRDADFDPGSGALVLSSLSGGQDGVLAVYASDGTLQRAMPLGSELQDGTTGLAVDDAGNAFITGHFTGTLNFNPTSDAHEITSVSRDQYIASYSPAGSLAWVVTMGNGFAQGSDITRNSQGDVLVAGLFSGEVFPDPQSTLRLTSHGGQDIMLASYQSDGTFRWAHAIGGPLAEVPGGVALGNAGEAYLTGFFEDAVDFNPGLDTLTATSKGEYDGFLVRYGADGSFPVAVEEDDAFLSDGFALKVFPNPAFNNVAVKMEARHSGPIKLALVDILGRRVKTLETRVSHGAATSFSMDVSSLPPGLYFIQYFIQSEGQPSRMTPVMIVR